METYLAVFEFTDRALPSALSQAAAWIAEQERLDPSWFSVRDVVVELNMEYDYWNVRIYHNRAVSPASKE